MHAHEILEVLIRKLYGREEHIGLLNDQGAPLGLVSAIEKFHEGTSMNMSQ